MGDVIPLAHRKVRLRIPGVVAPVRAVASELGPQGAIIDCELRWLRLGEQLEVELGPGELQRAVVRWIGVDVMSSPSQTARLRVALDFARPDEAAFFAQASERPSGHEPYAGYEVDMRARRRRSHLWACLIGLALGIGALQLPQVQWLVQRMARHSAAFSVPPGPMPRTINETDETPAERSSTWRAVPPAHP